MNTQTNGLDHDIETETGTMDALLEGSTALEAVDRASIDMQIATAKQYPRSVDRAIKEALTLATLDEDTAASMFYALPRSGKTIEGPSARLAEVMAYSWGNLRADADIVAEDRTHVTAMGTCFDLEKNVAIRVRVKRRITDKRGKRYNEDMIGVTSNAAISIALRNAVFKVIPAAMVRKVYHHARKASIGQAGTMAQKRQGALAWFAKAGVKEDEVFEQLGVRGLDDIGEDEVITLRGLVTAIKEGETTVEQVFRSSRDSGEGAADLNDALKKKKAGTKKEGAPPEEKESEHASDDLLDSLDELLVKARDSDVMTMDLEEVVKGALSSALDADVREAKRALSKALLAGAAEADEGGSDDE